MTYTNDDLDLAIDKGIFDKAAVTDFRDLIASKNNISEIDEENFKLVNSFNDIFVVIACSLLLFSSLWVLDKVNDILSFVVFTTLSWLVAEFFVRKKNMALPAIMLLLAFIGGVFGLCINISSHIVGDNIWELVREGSGLPFIIATAITSIAAYIHWKRFQVPITIAAGTCAVIGFLLSIIMSIESVRHEWLSICTFICGIITFLLAMYWDSSDLTRKTRRSDVAFWLHLLAAPLIIHPIFSGVGILQGNENISGMIIVLVLYVLMTIVSLAVDRRALMASALVYVIYALASLINTYGSFGYSIAITGVFIGSILLLLSAYWHTTRVALVNILPVSMQKYLPSAH